MPIRFRFRRAAAQAAAKEIRRGSWGMGAAAVAAGIRMSSAGIAAAGAVCWIIMQVAAFVVDGLEDDEGDSDGL